MLEKRVSPTSLFYRLTMNARANNPQKVYILAKRKEKVMYFEEVRKEILTARRYCNLDLWHDSCVANKNKENNKNKAAASSPTKYTNEEFFKTDDLKSKTRAELLQMSAAAALQRSIAKNVMIKDKKKSIASKYVKENKRRMTDLGPTAHLSAENANLFGSLTIARAPGKKLTTT